MNKRDVVDRMLVIHEHITGLRADMASIHERIAEFQAEHDMLAEVLEKWPDGAATLDALDDDLPDTEPEGTYGRTKSSQKMKAIRPEEDEE